MNKHAATIAFDTVVNHLAGHAVSCAAATRARALAPSLNEAELRGRLAETDGARAVLDGLGAPPLSPMEDTAAVLTLAKSGAVLSCEELTGIAAFLATTARLSGYLAKAAPFDAAIASYAGALSPLPELREEIERSIRIDQVDDHASPHLASLRRRIEQGREQVRQKLEGMLRKNKDWFSEGFVVMRGGRYALPVKRQHRQQVQGTVLDMSSSGATVFIEPAAARRLSDDTASLVIEEENEVRRILMDLSELVSLEADALRRTISAMESLDFAFAKAKLSAEMDAVRPEVGVARRIVIRKGRHPLLDPAACVPLDFSIGEAEKGAGEAITGVVITGPNTGGKTVALKTIGLLSMMAQSGLHVPAEAGSIFSMHDCVLADIGDGQSISENLSTFSAHMTNVAAILRDATHESLVLLDELGSGTDPAEGMGLAVAILDALRARGCLLVATSHYPQVKTYAERTPGLINARMAFDRESLRPLYRLEVGQAGESCALDIARRLGLADDLLMRARAVAYPQGAAASESAGDLPRLDALPQEKRSASRIRAHVPKQTGPLAQDQYRLGDSVRVAPGGEIGIVFRASDDRGMIGVQVKGEKRFEPYRRLKLIAPAEVLYPDDYDFSIVFDSVSNRKARNKLDRGNPVGEVRYEDGDMDWRA